MKRKLYLVHQNARGATMVELAVIIPIVFAFLFAVLDTAFFLWQWTGVNVSARAAARAAATNRLDWQTGDCSNDNSEMQKVAFITAWKNLRNHLLVNSAPEPTTWTEADNLLKNQSMLRGGVTMTVNFIRLGAGGLGTNDATVSNMLRFDARLVEVSLKFHPLCVLCDSIFRLIRKPGDPTGYTSTSIQLVEDAWSCSADPYQYHEGNLEPGYGL